MTPQRYIGGLEDACTGCPSGPYEPCDPTYPHWQVVSVGQLTVPSSRAQRLGWRLAEGLEAIIDELVKLPPLRWMDVFLRGPVGRMK